jgi:hypothetical protein
VITCSHRCRRGARGESEGRTGRRVDEEAHVWVRLGERMRVPLTVGAEEAGEGVDSRRSKAWGWGGGGDGELGSGVRESEGISSK